MASRDAKAVVSIALVVGLVMAGAQFAGHVGTGASALMASATQALLSATTAAMLLFGGWRATADRFRELDFWGYVAPVLPLSIGAGYAIFEGIDRLRDLRMLERPQLAYAALGFSGIFAVLGLWSVASALHARKLSLRQVSGVRAAGEPVLFALLLQGFAALAAVALASLGVAVADRLQWRQADGVATIVIGSMMAAVAALFALETKSLITPRRDRDAHRTPPQTVAATVDDRAAIPPQTISLAAERDDAAALPAHGNRKSRKRSRRSGR